MKGNTDNMAEDTKKISFMKLSEKMKRKKNIFLSVFLFLFFGGYFVFFSSKVWLHTDSDLIKATSLQKAYIVHDREISIGRWQYSQKQQMMELELDINNKSTDGIEKYEYEALERRKGKLDTEVVINKPDFVILRLKNMPVNWREVSVHIQIDDSNMLKIYTNKSAVKMVDNIQNRSENGYRIEREKNMITQYRNVILQLRKEQTKLQEGIDQLNENKKGLEKNKKYETEKEKQDTDQQISSIESEVDSKLNKIKENDSDVKEYTERIQMANKKIADLKK